AIYLQLAGHGASQLGVGQHTCDGLLDYLLRLTLEALFVLLGFHTARKPRVVVVDLTISLKPRDLDLRGVDYDHVIAGVKKWSVLNAVFAREDARHATRQPAQCLAGSVDDKPLARNFPFGEIG